MKPVPTELLILKQLADGLYLPVFIVLPNGDLLFYNEPAEEILGKRFEETGKMKVEEWSTVFKPLDQNGNPLPPESLPLVISMTQQIPASKSLWIESLKQERLNISVTSFPILSNTEELLGAVAIFWKDDAATFS